MVVRHRPRLKPTISAFCLSLLVHLVAALIISVQTIPPPAPVMKRPAPSAPIPLLSEQELKKLRQRKTPKATKPKREERERIVKRRQQIVEIPPPKVEKIPTESRFLAEFNSSVKREMVHRARRAPQAEMRKSDKRSLLNGKDLNGKRRGQRRLNSKKRSQAKRDRQPVKRSPKRGAQTKQFNQKKTRPKRNKGAKMKLGDGNFKHQAAESARTAEQAYGVKSQSMRGKGAEKLTPTHYQSLLPMLGPQNLARRDGSLDHVKEVERGDQTALNTREFRYAFFFNRVKRDVSARWNPANELGRADPRGKVYGVRDRKTVLAISLKADGTIAKISVVEPSGIPLLDREAVSAFLRAQPFHNPPEGLLEEDGLIRFKFGFYLEIGSRSFKLFR